MLFLLLKGMELIDGLELWGTNMYIPEVISRRPYDDDLPDGYLESDNDFIENNKEAVIWFLENRNLLNLAIRNMERDLRELTK